MDRPSATISVHVGPDRFDPAAEAGLLSGHGEVGAVVSFAGYCRSENGRLSALELEHYPGMAEAEIRATAEEAARRWPIIAARIRHRHGRIEVGQEIVSVVIAAGHRGAAFAAAELIMDWLKTRAPFWKREIAADGTAGGWVEARAEDDEAAGRWARQDAAE